MPNIQPSFKPRATVEINNATEVRITNFDVTTAGVEESHALVSDLKQLIIKTRGAGTIQFSFVSGQSGLSFFTVHKDAAMSLTDLDFTGTTLYFQVDKVDTVEILELY